jgi:hypothetical protein
MHPLPDTAVWRAFAPRLRCPTADEYLYTPIGKKWPEAFQTCMYHNRIQTGMYTLRRTEILPSRTAPEAESHLWTTPAQSLAQHPLTHYDRVLQTPHSFSHSKNIVSPATDVIAYFVHEGKVLHGHQRYMDHMRCVQLLHVGNFHGSRAIPNVTLDRSVPLKNWFLQKPKGQAPAPQ